MNTTTTRISVSEVPDVPLDPASLNESADSLQSSVQGVDDLTEDVANKWSNLREPYDTSDTAVLMYRMKMVQNAGQDFTESLTRTANALTMLAEELLVIKVRGDQIRLEISGLRSAIQQHTALMRTDMGLDIPSGTYVLSNAQHVTTVELRGECPRMQDKLDQAIEECQDALAKEGPAPLLPSADIETVGPLVGFNAANTYLEDLVRDIRRSILDRLAANDGIDAKDLLRSQPEWVEFLLDDPPSPEYVREWWNSLDREVAATLVADASMIVGNLNGVRLDDRIGANRINVHLGILAELAKIRESQEGIANLAKKYAPGPIPLAASTNYPSPDALAKVAYDAQIAASKEKIAAWRKLHSDEFRTYGQNGEEHLRQGAQVVAFDPARDSIVTYHGPIDATTGEIPSWIKNVAVSVPGTGTNMTGWADNRAQDIYEAEMTRETAVFQWAGGEFPQGMENAVRSHYSHDLAPKLASFTNSLETPADSTLTVLGHSYGGAALGLAQTEGLKADRILYVASAGIGDNNYELSDFKYTSDVPQYAIMSRNDAVVGAIQPGPMDWMHGASAQSVDGITRLESGKIDASDPNSVWLDDYKDPNGGPPAMFASHSTVYQRGSTSFNNILAVITGGTAELHAPDRSYSSISGPANRFPDYEPQYVDIE